MEKINSLTKFGNQYVNSNRLTFMLRWAVVGSFCKMTYLDEK